MNIFRRMRRSRDQRHHELDEEVRAHLAMAIRDRIAQGESPETAEQNARREFGNVTHVKEVTASMWPSMAWDHLWRDLRYTWRGLTHSAGFAVTVALTFALGVGANAAVFSLIDPLLVRNPPGVVEPKQVHRVYYRGAS